MHALYELFGPIDKEIKRDALNLQALFGDDVHFDRAVYQVPSPPPLFLRYDFFLDLANADEKRLTAGPLWPLKGVYAALESSADFVMRI